MPEKQNILNEILLRKFKPGNPAQLPGLTINDLKKAGVYREVLTIYKSFGGIMPEIPIRFGKWDIVLDDFIVEFDEEQHFNRYRRLTLNSLIYSVTPHFDLNSYLKYCDIYEEECLAKVSRGKYWTSHSTEKQFGNPGPNGILEGNGSPRWKQRAFYDYLRDVYALIFKIPVVRVSIYEELLISDMKWTIEKLMSGNFIEFEQDIVNLVNQRLNI